MEILHTIADFRVARRASAGSWGAVPTMGYLHEGHLSLVRRARGENNFVVATIFVNPTQFGPNEDFARYPRAPEQDARLLAEAGADFLFSPSVAEMYPVGFSTYVETGGITDLLEGASRPGHFRGVTTVVTKLFNILQPDRAYFGQKDAQQARVLRKLVTDLAIAVEVVVCPTVREPDGLAMSSRNSYLSPEQRRAATVLYRALCAASAAVQAGERSGGALRSVLRATIETEPLAVADYVSVADPESLEELDTVEGMALTSLAVRFGGTRLIDNMVLEMPAASR